MSGVIAPESQPGRRLQHVGSFSTGAIVGGGIAFLVGTAVVTFVISSTIRGHANR